MSTVSCHMIFIRYHFFVCNKDKHKNKNNNLNKLKLFKEEKNKEENKTGKKLKINNYKVAELVGGGYVINM